MFTAIAHRGDNRRFTENTRAAFDSSLEHGFTALELDLVRIKDGTVVLFHDDTLERLCGVSLNARDLTYHQFKAAFPELLTLYEFMALYGRNELSLNFEIKGDRYTFAGVEPYLSFCTDPLISSFDLDLMRDVRAAGLPAGFLVHTGPELLSVLRDFPGARIHASHELVPLLYGLQSALAAGNHTVYLYTVNQPAHADYLAGLPFISGVFTDNSEFGRRYAHSEITSTGDSTEDRSVSEPFLRTPDAAVEFVA